MTPKLISAKELAERYSVAPKKIRKWARIGILPSSRSTADAFASMWTNATRLSTAGRGSLETVATPWLIGAYGVQHQKVLKNVANVPMRE